MPNKNINLKEILAYKQISSKKKARKANFISLQKIVKKCSDPIFDDLKVYLVLTLKWHFDYLAKTRKDPTQLNTTLEFWQNIFFIFSELKKNGWITLSKKIKNKKDIWKITRHAFDFMWPKNTDQKKFLASSYLAKVRMKQIISKISKNRNFFKDKIVLDSGCGPGRYIDYMITYKPKKIIGIDSGKNIILNNKKKFKKFKNVEFLHSKFDTINLKSSSVDFVISAGVLHHTKTPMNKLIKEHARIIKKDGYFFVFIAGSGGQELDLWKFCRRIMIDVKIDYAFKTLNNKISPLRLQGYLDHSYGEYKSTNRKEFEKMLKANFRIIKKIDGISGADVTVKTFENDKFFKKRFGSGNLRYLCKK